MAVAAFFSVTAVGRLVSGMLEVLLGRGEGGVVGGAVEGRGEGGVAEGRGAAVRGGDPNLRCTKGGRGARLVRKIDCGFRLEGWEVVGL